MKNKTLASLLPEMWGEVDFVYGESDISRRLKDLGLISGTKVLCLQKSPLGDPVAYEIRGAVIALRNKDANLVFLK